jgi:hypothetical protein
MFADAMKTSRLPWTSPDGLTTAAADGDGWPLQDAAIRVWSGNARMDGTYTLTFQGQADVQACCTGTLSFVAFDGITSTWTLTIPDAASHDLTLTFRNTRAGASSPTNTGIKNVRLMRPQSEGSASSYDPAVTFTTDFKKSLAPFSTLRFADFLASNGNPQQNWSERVTKTSASQTVPATGGTQNKGAAYEYAFQLCTELQKDCWINIPVSASDDYVTNVARLAQSMLPSSLHLYVEYSSELWNTAPGHQQSSANDQLAQADVASGRLPLAFDGSTNRNYLAWRRIAARGAQISVTFRQTFGDAAMMSRIRPVLMTQLGNADGPLQQAVYIMQNYYNSPTQVTATHPIGYYFYGIGGGADYAPADPSSVDTVLGSMPQSTWPADLQKDAHYAAAFGLHRIAYEGGPNLAKTMDAAANANLAAAHDDPRIVQTVVAAHNTWSANGGDLLMYYTIAGDYTWGFLDDVFDLNVAPRNYKMQAMTTLAAGNRAPATIGTALPSSIPASLFSVPASWLQGEGITGFSQLTWFGYTTHVDVPGTFAIGLRAGSADGGGSVDVFVDGTPIGTITATAVLGPTGSTGLTATLPVSLNAGMHGILIRGSRGTSKLALSSIEVTRTASASAIRRR